MHTKDDLIAAAQAVAQRLGTDRLSLIEFRAATRIPPQRVYKLFGTWRDFCAAAGLSACHPVRAIPDETIFRGLHDALLASGGAVSLLAVEGRVPFSRKVIRRRFGPWHGALTEFAEWADKNAPDFPYRVQLAKHIARRRSAKLADAPPPSGPPWPATGARLSGDPLNDCVLQHEPINEYGVVLAFGTMAKELGYIVDSVAGAFPDCLAKRRVGARRWQPVRIEFEFKSRNFVEHGHDPNGCDVIVCWEHDWPDCPLEVLELKRAMAR
jgi:hypothetical protein